MKTSQVWAVVTAVSAAVTLVLAAGSVTLPVCTEAPVNSITCHSITAVAASDDLSVKDRSVVPARLACRKSLPLKVTPSVRMVTRGKLLVRSTAVPSVTLLVVAVVEKLPRCTTTPLVNSATYQLIDTAPVVPSRANVTVVVSLICPEICESMGFTESTLTLNTRNDFVRSTAVRDTVAELAPSAIDVVPDWTAFRPAARTPGGAPIARTVAKASIAKHRRFGRQDDARRPSAVRAGDSQRRETKRWRSGPGKWFSRLCREHT